MKKYRVKTEYFGTKVGDVIYTDELNPVNEVALKAGFLEEIKERSAREALVEKMVDKMFNMMYEADEMRGALTVVEKEIGRIIPYGGILKREDLRSIGLDV